jgi:hypothetical protein
MILFIEGPRACGKTYLINDFLEVCNNPNVEYYKFYFADHIKTLSLTGLDKTPSLHYFSLGNIMTIMEMNLQPEYVDKIWIFDRAIISAYTWAILRGRLTKETAEAEYRALLKSDLFKNCKTLMITTDKQTKDTTRKKDIFDGAHTTIEEQQIMGSFIQLGLPFLASTDRNNGLGIVINQFDDSSINSFNQECQRLLGELPNK